MYIPAKYFMPSSSGNVKLRLRKAILSSLISTWATISSTTLFISKATFRFTKEEWVSQWQSLAMIGLSSEKIISSQGGRSRSLILLTTDVCRLAQQLYIRYYPLTVENIFCFVFCDSVSCIFSWVFRNILCKVVNLSNWKSFCFPSVDTLFSRNILTEGGFSNCSTVDKFQFL